jgi:hypothetical protein
MKSRTHLKSPLARARLDQRIHKAIATFLLFSTTLSYAVPPDYAAAGRAQGSLDSTGEAKRQGRINGLEDGKNQGYQQGYAECADQMRRQAQQDGQRQGDRDATLTASTDGSGRGNVDGAAKGQTDGAVDGDGRADRQAYADATPRGTAAGIAEANKTDAAARGTVDGKVAGNSAAKTDADKNEYQPARDQYKKERYAESIRSESTIDMNAPAAAVVTSPIKQTAKANSSARGFANTKSTTSAALLSARVDALNLVQASALVSPLAGNPGDPQIPNVQPTAASDKAIAYCKANTTSVALASTGALIARLSLSPAVVPSGTPQPRPIPSHLPHPGPLPTGTPAPQPSPTVTPPPAPVSQFEKCVEDYKPAYEQAFLATFKTEYLNAYRPGFDQQYAAYRPNGCNDARRADYRRDYNDSYKRSYDETYRLVFDRVYKQIYGQAYNAAFTTSSNATFNQTYQGHYDTHYAEAKAKAFAARQDQLYTDAFNAGKNAEYAAQYPGYKKTVIARGRTDEAADFVRIPVRLIGLAMKEAVKDGIQEPGEKLTVDMDLRNFADTPIAARDLDIRAVAKTTGVALPGSVVILKKDLTAKSLTHVTGALDIRLDESALGQTAQVEIQISVRGNRLATETINLNARTLTKIALVETPVVRLGYPGSVKVRVTNQSSLVLPENATLSLSTNMTGVTFSKSSDAVNGLGAGEARDIEFPFQADNYADGQDVLFTAALNLTSGRRIGMLNESREIPSLQDYSFKASNGVLLGDISDLRKSGKTRIKIYLKNISSRQATETVTLTASVIGPNASNFSFAKGQQDSFQPIAPGQEVESNKMVIKAKKSNSGGTFVVEVREGGKLLGSFKQAF